MSDKVDVQPGSTAVAAIETALIGELGEFQGTVTESGGGTPVANMGVRVYSATDGIFVAKDPSNTSAGGNYSIGGLPPGDYLLYFWNRNVLAFDSEWYDSVKGELPQQSWKIVDPITMPPSGVLVRDAVVDP